LSGRDPRKCLKERMREMLRRWRDGDKGGGEVREKILWREKRREAHKGREREREREREIEREREREREKKLLKRVFARASLSIAEFLQEAAAPSLLDLHWNQ